VQWDSESTAAAAHTQNARKLLPDSVGASRLLHGDSVLHSAARVGVDERTEVHGCRRFPAESWTRLHREIGLQWTL
jgi:hypothetical protein